MALESVPVAETLIQSNEVEDNDLEDGEIPSDEDDEPTPPPPPPRAKTPELQKPLTKSDSIKEKTSDKSSSKSKNKSSSNNNSNKPDRFLKNKNPSDDWASDVEKAIKAALDYDKKKDDNKTKNKGLSSGRSKNRKRSRDDKEEERNKDQKKRRLSEEENGNDDDDEFMFVRGASPTNKRDSREMSPPQRCHERDNFEGRDSDRDSEERARHRGEKRNENRGTTPRRSSRNERSSKSKNRNSARNDRNARRNQNNDQNQDADAICVYFMQGKCHRGDDCPFSHNALPPRKMELCKFYLMDCCAKRDKCLYMHHDFPCKFYHTGLKCQTGVNCKFSHNDLTDQVKNVLLKHLETAPKEILGDFPRLSRESALMMINNTQRARVQGIEPSVQKIPSLFDVTLPTPPNQSSNDKDEESSADNQKRKEKKGSGKKTRWGSDEDRVPLDQIMLLQSVSHLGMTIPNMTLNLAVQQQLQQRLLLQQCLVNMEFYKDMQGANDTKAKDALEKSDEKSLKSTETSNTNRKDVDLRQLMPNSTQKGPQVVSLADAAANLTSSKFDDESDREEESSLIIEVPQDEEDKNKDPDKDKKFKESLESDVGKNFQSEEAPNLPKTAQDLFLRIQQQQQQQKTQDESDDQKTIENVLRDQHKWYSDESDNDNDDDEDGGLQIVIKDPSRDENSEKSDQESPVKEPPCSLIPQPAPIVDKLGDLSKIDISAEVTKLLSSIKPQAKRNLEESSKEMAEKSRSKSPEAEKTSSKIDNEDLSSKPISRDPRMSRDPRQRRMEEAKPSSPGTSEVKKDSKSLRLETSIYSSGITDYSVDTDLRSRLDQDHRMKDLDLRQRYQDFGDTDLRINSFEGTSRSDVDLRQMLTLPFKPAPSHVPCTEIEASIASHRPVPYKVYVVDIPRPSYAGLKLGKDDSAMRHDPRLRKIFGLTLSDSPDSPMSPPPVSKIPDTPRSPPQIRADPRRKALEAQIPINPVLAANSGEIPMSLGGSMIPGVGIGMNSMMNGPMQGQIPMGMVAGNANMQQGQMSYADPRFIQRNGGPGLLGPAPGLGYSEGNFEQGYSGNNFNNFPPNEQMMGFGNNQVGFGNNGGDWTSGNSNPVRNRGRVRRRNRNRLNAGGARANRSPP